MFNNMQSVVVRMCSRDTHRSSTDILEFASPTRSFSFRVTITGISGYLYEREELHYLALCDTNFVLGPQRDQEIF
jgi:hypothetical protein